MSTDRLIKALFNRYNSSSSTSQSDILQDAGVDSSNLTFLYSLKNINNSSNYAAKVRRSSDDEEFLINFSNGTISKSELFTNGGSNDQLYISEVYDDDGNILASQTTASYQPLIYDSGAAYDNALFDGVDDYLLLNPDSLPDLESYSAFTVFVKVKKTSSDDDAISFFFGSGSLLSNKIIYSFTSEDNTAVNFTLQNDGSTTGYNIDMQTETNFTENYYIYAITYDSSNTEDQLSRYGISTDGSVISSVVSDRDSSVFGSCNYGTIGAAPNSSGSGFTYFLEGSFDTLMVFDTALTQEQLSILASEI